MSLKVSVSTPISSREVTSILREKSPSATRMAPSVSRWMGMIMVLDSRKESKIEMNRPKTSDSRISTKIWLIRLFTVVLLSRM